MIGFIGTSLQLHWIITAHTLNSFWTASVGQMSMKILSLLSTTLEFANELPFITVRKLNRDHRLQGFHYCSLWMGCLRNVHELLPSKMGNFVSGSTLLAFRQCLLSVTLQWTSHCRPSCPLPFIGVIPPSFFELLQFVCLRWLILVVEGEIRVWLTSSDLGRMRFLSQGIWQGLSLCGGEKNSVLLHSTFKHWWYLLM
jgi:hypothetical protein